MEPTILKMDDESFRHLIQELTGTWDVTTPVIRRLESIGDALAMLLTDARERAKAGNSNG